MSHLKLALCVASLAAIIVAAEGQNVRNRSTPPRASAVPEAIHVDPARGDDANPGTEARPVKSISAALALLPDPVTRGVTIRLFPGSYTTTGDHGMAGNTLGLMRRMRPGRGKPLRQHFAA